MPERTSHKPGTLSWADLATTDQEGAKAFYGGLFGWEYEDVPVGEGQTYSMAKLGGRSAAAMATQQPDETAAGIPPHWNVYVTVDDVDAVSVSAAEEGGTVWPGRSTCSTPGACRSSLIRTARSCACGRRARASAPRSSTSRARWPGRTPRRRTRRPRRASTSRCSAGDFEQMSEEPPYWVISNDERSNGGMTVPPPGVPSNWFPYFAVDDVDAAIEQAKDAGGNPFIGPIDVPNGGRFALIQDPQGAAFAVLSSEQLRRLTLSLHSDTVGIRIPTVWQLRA